MKSLEASDRGASGSRRADSPQLLISILKSKSDSMIGSEYRHSIAKSIARLAGLERTPALSAGQSSRLAVRIRQAAAALSLGAALAASSQEPAPQASRETTTAASRDQASNEDAERTELNLLGAVASEEGEARHNENVRITLIDNNVLRELTARIGTTANVPADLAIEDRYFGAEFGQPARRALEAAALPVPKIRGELRWTHQTSVTSARSFFQVGACDRPATTRKASRQACRSGTARQGPFGESRDAREAM